MVEDLDAQIQSKEAVLAPFLKHMETLRLAFIEETVRFASEWYKKTVKEYVVKYPQVLLSLKEQPATQMKAKVSELVRDSEKTVKTEFANPQLWWHLKPRLNESTKLYLQIGDQPPEILDRAVRHVLGRLGLILEEYRFNVSATGESFSFKEFWFDRPLEKGSAAVPSYPHLLDWSREMQQIIQEDNFQFVKVVDVYSELQELEQEKKKQQAMSRWDSI
jgi:hypothetical protein